MRRIETYQALKDLTNVFLCHVSRSLRQNEVLGGGANYADRFIEWLNVPTLKGRLHSPEWFMLIHNAREEVTTDNAYLRVGRLLSNDEVISTQLGTLTGYYGLKVRTDIDSVLTSFLYAYLFSSKKLTEADNGDFDQLFSEFERYFDNETIRIRTIAPLYNFQMEDEEIVFSENLRLMKLPEEEIFGPLPRSIMHGFNTTYESIAFEGFGIEYIEDCKKLVGDNSQSETNRTPQIREVFDRVLSALRLYKDGNVSYSFVKTEPVGWNPLVASFSSHLHSPSVFFGNRYTLESGSGKDVAVLSDTLESCKDKKRLSISLRRFNFAHERINSEDEIIDYLIGLEALLVPSARQEISYRLSLRCAFLAGKTTQTRNEIFSHIRKAYDVRSSLVHGDKQPNHVIVAGATVPFKEFLSRIRAIMRTILSTYIDAARDRKEDDILDSIESDIIKGSNSA